MKHNHKALHRYNDQYYCHHCGKQWDVGEEWPRCKTNHDKFLDMLDKLKIKNKTTQDGKK